MSSLRKPSVSRPTPNDYPGTPPGNEFLGATDKLTIGSLDDAKLQVVAQYNPRELEIKKAHNWSDSAGTDKQIASSELEYKGQTPAGMTVELLFDGYETGGMIGAKSIMMIISDLEKLAAPRAPSSKDQKQRRPHHCVVAWGRSKDRPGDCMPKFMCVIESIATKYQMFSSTGTVLRATCTVQLKQCNRTESISEEVVDEWFRR